MLSHSSTWRGNWKLVPGLSWTLLYAPLSFADFKLCPFTVVNYNPESNSFAEVCVSSWGITEPKDGLDDPPVTTIL